MKLLIDANVLLDVLQDRKPYVHDSSLVWKLCETENTEGFVTTLTFANMVYIMRKEMSPEKISRTLHVLSLIFTFVDFTVNDMMHAADSGWDDYEDAIHCAIADRIHADFIITRNIRDFTNSKVTALSPSELIARIL